VFVVAEMLYEPVHLAGVLGVELLLALHGVFTNSIEGSQAIDRLENPDLSGVNLTPGIAWPGGADPVLIVRTFQNRFRLARWKDPPAEWKTKRGARDGCEIGLVVLGEGMIDIRGVYDILKDSRI
jgi:hypothetical protein